MEIVKKAPSIKPPANANIYVPKLNQRCDSAKHVPMCCITPAPEGSTNRHTAQWVALAAWVASVYPWAYTAHLEHKGKPDNQAYRNLHPVA